MHAPCSYRGPLYSYRCGKTSPALHPYRSGNLAPHLVAGDHMVARLDRGDTGSDALDDAGGLVPQDARKQALGTGMGMGAQSRLVRLRPQTLPPPHRLLLPTLRVCCQCALVESPDLPLSPSGPLENLPQGQARRVCMRPCGTALSPRCGCAPHRPAGARPSRCAPAQQCRE